MASRFERIHGKRHSGVAPHEIVREDFEWLTTSRRLRTTRTVEEEVFMQSIEGHAHEGHAAFRGHPYVNTTMEDIVDALNRDPQAVARHRQLLVDDIFNWAERAIAGRVGNLLLTEEGDCLLDIGLLRQVEVDPAQVLRGLYVGGMRDNLEVRRRAEAKYGVSIGGGHSYLVDARRMEEMGLDARQLAKGSHEAMIDEYRAAGLIVADEGARDGHNRVRYLYIRHRTGNGTSDDAAMLAAGKLFGPGAAVGGFLADAIDTFEKYTSTCADQDYKLARRIEESWPDLAVSEEDLLRAVRLCMMPDGADVRVPDCSLRYVLEINRNVDQNAFESHLLHVQGRPHAPMKLGSEEVRSADFYAWFERQWREFGR